MIKYLVMDVDGTLTDGKIYTGKDGEVIKAFHVKDGCGIHDLLIPSGIIPIIITGRISEIVINRCNEIGVTNLHQGISDKQKKLEEILAQQDSSYKEVAYIGDDINDLSCIQKVLNAGGLAGCPFDAAEDIKKLVPFVSKKNGGDGAVREFIEWILAHR